jgi:hypothetical protein
VEDLEIVPPEVFFRLGEDRTVSVLARTAGIEPGQSVEIVLEPGGILELLDGSSVPLQPHRRREDVLSGQLHLRPLIEGETLVSASIDGRDALALMTVRPAIEREEPEPEELIEALEFEKPRYRVRWNKNKELSLRAPVELVERFGSSLCVISNDPGIVVTRGGKVSLAIGPGDPVARGTCRVEGRQLGAKARIRAELGDQIAHCYIVVDQRDDGLPRLQIALVNEEPTVYRALFHPSDVQPGEEQTIKVYARHKGLKRYFGDAPEFPGQDTPAARAVVAEVVTEAIVRRIVSRKYPTANEEIDADLVYFEHVSYTSRLLPIMQQMSMGPLQTQ